MRVVRDSKTLTALAAAGFIEYPIEPGHHYVREKTLAQFEWEGKQYIVRYPDGCFYALVYEIVKNGN